MREPMEQKPSRTSDADEGSTWRKYLILLALSLAVPAYGVAAVGTSVLTGASNDLSLIAEALHIEDGAYDYLGALVGAQVGIAALGLAGVTLQPKRWNRGREDGDESGWLAEVRWTAGQENRVWWLLLLICMVSGLIVFALGVQAWGMRNGVAWVLVAVVFGVHSVIVGVPLMVRSTGTGSVVSYWSQVERLARVVSLSPMAARDLLADRGGAIGDSRWRFRFRAWWRLGAFFAFAVLMFVVFVGAVAFLAPWALALLGGLSVLSVILGLSMWAGHRRRAGDRLSESLLILGVVAATGILAISVVEATVAVLQGGGRFDAGVLVVTVVLGIGLVVGMVLVWRGGVWTWGWMRPLLVDAVAESVRAVAAARGDCRRDEREAVLADVLRDRPGAQADTVRLLAEPGAVEASGAREEAAERCVRP
ncbi:hypothetical protein [Actinomyces sp. B33]|uniref:hypothetical protein n=1 Tax=Actinomyces sp. B33 TaxID=2942131 RepID=UPI002340D0F0|nr:hypothetical protein [Actinomyces sp. B33]